MAKKLRGPELVKEIDKQLDKAMAVFIFNTQSKLSAASPVLTGRLASSWFIGKNTPERYVEPEHESLEINITRSYALEEIKFDGTWYISSNLPYTYRAAFDPYNGRRGGGDWFTRIENKLAKDAERAFDYYLRKVK